MTYQHSPGRTNQKLMFARLQLEALLERDISYEDLAEVALVHATCEAVATHLKGAWLALLVEIGGLYGLQESEFDSPTALIEALAEREIVSPEAMRLANLETMANGWVSDMLSFARESDCVDSHIRLCDESNVVSEGNVIDVVDSVMVTVLDNRLAMLRGCLEALEGLVEALRTTMMEW